jgi:hypothetical protein
MVEKLKMNGLTSQEKNILAGIVVAFSFFNP